MEIRIGKKAEIKNKTSIFIGVLIAIGILATIVVLLGTAKSEDLKSCGETICGEFNQEYRGWVQDKLECTFNYESFGYPEVEEIFSFTINESMKERMCN